MSELAIDLHFAPWISYLLSYNPISQPKQYQTLAALVDILNPVIALDIKIYDQYFTKGRKEVSLSGGQSHQSTFRHRKSCGGQSRRKDFFFDKLPVSDRFSSCSLQHPAWQVLRGIQYQVVLTCHPRCFSSSHSSLHTPTKFMIHNLWIKQKYCSNNKLYLKYSQPLANSNLLY